MIVVLRFWRSDWSQRIPVNKLPMRMGLVSTSSISTLKRFELPKTSEETVLTLWHFGGFGLDLQYPWPCAHRGYFRPGGSRGLWRAVIGELDRHWLLQGAWLHKEALVLPLCGFHMFRACFRNSWQTWTSSCAQAKCKCWWCVHIVHTHIEQSRRCEINLKGFRSCVFLLGSF